MAKTRKTPKTSLRTWHYYWQDIKRPKPFALLLTCMVLTPIVVFIRAVLAPLIFARLIDLASQGLPSDQLLSSALNMVVAFFVIFAIEKIILEPVRLWSCWKGELYVIRSLGAKCFDVIAAQSMQFHNNRFSGSLVSQTNKFVNSFERLADVVIWDLWPILTYFVMVIIVLSLEAPQFAIGIGIFILLYAIFAYFSFKKLAPLNEKEADAENKQTGQLADSITNIISVKSYAREPHERNRFGRAMDHVFSTASSVMHACINRDIKFGFVQTGITGLILVFLIFGREWLGVSIATLVLIVTYAQSIQGELWTFTHIFKNLNRSFGDAHDMTLILDTPDDVVDLPGAKKLHLEQAEVKFENISFQHADARDAIFHNFSLDIKPGERVGLVGVSGSGKTTLTKLLLRFADVDAGEITISGQNIKNVTQASLREQIAYVPQETSLFHRSIAENIAYSHPSASSKEIEHAVKLANADEFIRELPNGYSTLVGERGVKLSGGQRQRVAIARAILKDAPILVLDEATSALDSESEALIQDALLHLMKDRTSIVIAHRLSTVASLDRIVVLDDGKIVEQGTHAELLKKGGVYHHLWSRQSGAFMKDQ